VTRARSPLAGRSTVYAPRAAIATSQPLASATGLEVLQGGGNAVDAAVAAAAVLGVVEPHMTGMGGDLFAILWSAEEGRLVGLDASGRAGSGTSLQALSGHGGRMPRKGYQAITVPGALSGWAALTERYGTRSLGDLLAPAIRLAEEGFPVSPVIASQWRAVEGVLQADAGARSTFLNKAGRAPLAGEWFRNPDMAASLDLVAAKGPAALYGGELGRKVVEALARGRGFVTLADLAEHEARWVDPISVDFLGHTVWELPPAGQGIAALQILALLEPFDLTGRGHNTAEYLHLLIEAKKLAFADLDCHVADADAMTTSPSALLDPDYIAERRALIDLKRAAEQPEPGVLATAGETVYLAAADAQGNMVSLINSIFEHFGSGVVAPGTGFALQNRGAGFNLQEGHPNCAAAGKRPLHTIIPGFVTRGGEPWLAFGVMGGSMQPQGHVQVLVNLLAFGMDLQEAIDAPRFRHLSGRAVALEPVDPPVREKLEAMGHVLQGTDGFGGGQAVMRLERGWAAGSDPRKDGMAVGW
jgi:gamma-glutamyltranspeptidase/glutathione hydrolase